MNAQQLVDEWITQSKPKNKASSLLYEDKTIYSYGHHWPLARLTSGKQAIVNNDKYSITTTKHLGRVKQGLRKAGILMFDMKTGLPMNTSKT